MTLILTLIVGAVFAACCIMLISLAITGTQMVFLPEKNASGDVLLTFALTGLFFALVAYWSGNWLFFADKETEVPKQSSSQELVGDYLGPWRSNAPSNIISTLVSNNVRGCGEFHFKASDRNSGEYLVYCTHDGRNWSAYIVWPNIDRISGPARPDPKISLPR